MSAFKRSAQQWPWLERIAVWNLSTGLPADDEKRGYNILAADGTPKAAYHALAELARDQGSTGAKEPEDRKADIQPAEILAPDVMIRLSDPDTFYPHWARPHCGSVPCRQWVGQFYIKEPGTDDWRLCMQLMQVEEPGNLVWVNGHLLDPPALPLRDRPDFASVWTSAEIPVPAALLRPGVNTLEIGSSPRLPVYQDGRAHYESLQFRHLRLTTGF